MKPILTIGIPTFDNMAQLDWCIKSLFMYTEYPYKVVIVNNHPPLKEQLGFYVATSNVGELLTVRHMERNVGWMPAVNLVLSECDTKFFCMLNDDVVFLPGHQTFWRKLVECLLEEDVGAVGPCSNFVSGCQSLLNLNVPEIVDTKYLIGLCLVTRTDLLRKLGGLDEALPGGDDLDLSLRMRKAGYRLMIRRDCYLHHFGQQTGKRVDGAHWDSKEHQDDSNNALIRKHGVENWYGLLEPGWSYTPGTLKRHEGESEVTWIAEHLQSIKGEGLNLGCGSMKYELPGLRILGVDKSLPGEHGTGGTKFYGATPDIVGDATKLDFAVDGSMDVLLAQHLLEHLIDPVAALDRWWEVLRGGGDLLLTVPDQGRMDTIMLDCTHVHAYTVESLTRLVARCGFRVLECCTISWGVIMCHAKKEVEESEL